MDENFAVVDECFPYIARRLLSDNNPRIRESLRTFIYNGENRLDVEKLEVCQTCGDDAAADLYLTMARTSAQDVAKGFSSFTNTMDASALARGDGSTRQLDAATRDLVSLLFSPEGNYLQDLLIDEAVRAVDALSRDSLVRLWKRLAGALKHPVSISTVGAARPLGPALHPGARGDGLMQGIQKQLSKPLGACCSFCPCCGGRIPTANPPGTSGSVGSRLQCSSFAEHRGIPAHRCDCHDRRRRGQPNHSPPPRGYGPQLNANAPRAQMMCLSRISQRSCVGIRILGWLHRRLCGCLQGCLQPCLMLPSSNQPLAHRRTLRR